MLNGKTIGAGALLLVGFFYGLSGALAKYVTSFISPLQASEVRFVIAFFLVMLLFILLRKRASFVGLSRKMLLIYALAFPSCVILFTLSIFHSSVALATAAAYGSALVFSFLLGRVFFAEKITLAKSAAFFLTLIALLIFTKPWDDFVFSLGLVFAILSGFLQGVSNSVQKSLNRAGADHNSLLLLQCAVGALLTFLVVFFFSEDPLFVPEGNPLLLLLYGGASVATIYLFLVGFKYIDVNTGSILVSSQLFFGPAIAWLFLDESAGSHVILGGVIILLAGILANWPQKNPA